MKRLVALLVVAMVATLGLSLVGPSAQATNLDNFRISNFEIEYQLDRDDEQRSTLAVTERITAEFPDYNQNKGLVREIPIKYDGRSVRFELQSVTRNGQSEPIYDEYSKHQHRVIELGTDEYVRGAQVYELRYELRDVTRYFDDIGRDEFYWDTNGVGWRVPIDNLSVKLEVADQLRNALTGDTACYQGVQGSSQTCNIDGGEGSYTAVATGLSSGENVTIAIGFEPETFAPYQPTMLERLIQFWTRSLWLSVPLGLLAVAGVTLHANRWSSRKDEIGTIVPEYLPLKGTSVSTAAELLGASNKVVAAQLIDLAVRGYVNIVETRPKSFWRQAEYDLVLARSVSKLLPEETELLVDIFGFNPEVGARVATDKMRKDYSLGRKLSDNRGKLQKLIRSDYGLKKQNPAQGKQLRKVALGLLAIAVATLGPTLLAAAAAAFTLSFTVWPLTDKGLTMRRYLEGLKLYIGVAEAERLKMLQSPEGAKKIGSVNPEDQSQLIRLYEKLLPYAVLFGQEEQWNKVLGEYYQTTDSQPVWYHGATPFNVASLGQVTSSISSIGAASSSSGGSGGGGFSGGGGGGGGGGGR